MPRTKINGNKSLPANKGYCRIATTFILTSENLSVSPKHIYFGRNTIIYANISSKMGVNRTYFHTNLKQEFYLENLFFLSLLNLALLMSISSLDCFIIRSSNSLEDIFSNFSSGIVFDNCIIILVKFSLKFSCSIL